MYYNDYILSYKKYFNFIRFLYYHTPGNNFGFYASTSVSQSYNAAKADVRYAARIIGQALRDNSPACFFTNLPKELSNKIVRLSTDNAVFSEEEVSELVEPNLGKPS